MADAKQRWASSGSAPAYDEQESEEDEETDTGSDSDSFDEQSWRVAGVTAGLRSCTDAARCAHRISWFCALKGNEFFCAVDTDYIRDDFNLSGLSAQARARG